MQLSFVVNDMKFLGSILEPHDLTEAVATVEVRVTLDEAESFRFLFGDICK